MNEVIGTILEAEAKAEEIVSEGERESRRAIEAGAAAAEQTKADAERLLLSEREKKLAEAEREAEERYRALNEEAKAEAECFGASCQDKIEAAAQSAVRKVFGA